VRVVAFEQAVAAPLATRHLADLGADVVKVERIGEGDFARAYDSAIHGTSTWFAWLNRGKRSLTLDMKHERGREIAERLVTNADVVVQNFAPGAFDRLGLGVDQLRERYPRLISCEITGYGETGPYRDRKAYDLLLQAETGVISISGTPESPAKTGISVADISAGMYAFSACVAALYRRQVTGEGASIHTSLFDSIMEWMSPLSLMAAHGPPPQRAGARHASIVPYGPFRVANGRTVVIAVQNEREWARFCTMVLEQPQLLDDARFAGNGQRLAHRAELEAIIEQRFASLAAPDLIARLEAAGIANGAVNDVPAVANHPQLAARGRWVEVASPAGAIAALTPPHNLLSVAPHMGAVPALGEHTQQVLAELERGQ